MSLVCRLGSVRNVIDDITYDKTNQLYAEFGIVDCEKRRLKKAIITMVTTAVFISHAKVGNCHEFTMIALNYLMKNHSEINAEIFTVTQGDHVFVVIGGDHAEENLQQDYLGENAVICDPHAGEVYPASELHSRMTTHKSVSYPGRFSHWLNVQASYNPRCHGVKPSFSLSRLKY
jgi:hypothetical protein